MEFQRFNDFWRAGWAAEGGKITEGLDDIIPSTTPTGKVQPSPDSSRDKSGVHSPE
jgi:hypothetical protein